MYTHADTLFDLMYGRKREYCSSPGDIFTTRLCVWFCLCWNRIKPCLDAMKQSIMHFYYRLASRFRLESKVPKGFFLCPLFVHASCNELDSIWPLHLLTLTPFHSFNYPQQFCQHWGWKVLMLYYQFLLHLRSSWFLALFQR